MVVVRDGERAAQRLTLGRLLQGATWSAARGARPRLRVAYGSIYEGTAPCVAGGCGLGPAESAASLAMPRANASRRRGSPGARDPPSCGAAAVQYTARSVARTKKARMFPSSSRRHVADGSWIAVPDSCYASAVFCKTLLMALRLGEAPWSRGGKGSWIFFCCCAERRSISPTHGVRCSSLVAYLVCWLRW